MAIVVPTVTEAVPSAFHVRVLQLAGFTNRLHLDYADGILAPTELVSLTASSWPETLEVDLHIMYQHPAQHLEELLSLEPNQVTFHAEANGDLLQFMHDLQHASIKVFIALLPQSQPSDYAQLIEKADGVQIFGGKLGFQGGLLDISQLDKITGIREIHREAPIAWDGGINIDNANQLVKAGVSILNVGGAVSEADNPQAAYEALVEAVT